MYPPPLLSCSFAALSCVPTFGARTRAVPPSIPASVLRRDREQLTEHGRLVFCSFSINASRLALMVDEELNLQRHFPAPSA